MGLSRRLAVAATRRTHVLLVEVPGWWRTRVALEQAVAARGWREALSPADADALVVCGHPGDRLAGAVERVWEQLPGPRARATVASPEDVDAVLDEVAASLRECAHQRRDAEARTQGDGADEGGDDDSGGGHEGMDHGGGHEGMDHGGMDHGGMDMAPAGIPLAGGGPDRDGLAMDVLHVPLGPVLPSWPAGLVLHCALQGDVVTEASAEVLGSASPPPADERTPSAVAARHCDDAARLLSVAGWEDGAAAVRRVRDRLLTGTEPVTARDLDRLRARVVRARLLRWLLRDLGRVDEALRVEHELPAHSGGDVHDRLVATLQRARTALDGAHSDDGRPDDVLAALPSLVTGLDLAAVRLVVASLGLDTAAAAREAVDA